MERQLKWISGAAQDGFAEIMATMVTSESASYRPAVARPRLQAGVVAALVGLTASLPCLAQDTPKFDEKVAVRWALTALGVAHKKTEPKEALQKTLESTTSATYVPKITGQALDDAFAKLQPCRLKQSHNDLSITAAEHYMFMRYRAADSGDTNYRVLPKKYLELKKKKIADGTVKELQTTDQPVSPPSEDVRRWGEQGVEAGLLDYKRLTGKEPSSGVTAYAEGISFVLGTKYNYPYVEKRPCAISLQ